jgi:hypothetical protein
VIFIAPRNIVAPSQLAEVLKNQTFPDLPLGRNDAFQTTKLAAMSILI